MSGTAATDDERRPRLGAAAADSAAARGVAVVIGAGPAGLMAAEQLSAAGVTVQLFDASASVGRKFLLAGKGGLNLAHAEPLARQLARYRAAAPPLAPLLRAFGPEQLRDWARGLGVETFVGSSGRVFPHDLKAAPLLRAWLARLRHPDSGGAAVQLRMRHRWTGWDAGGALRFETPQGPLALHADCVILALGGASWPQLGSTGAWVAPLQARGVPIAPLAPSNCGFDVGSGERRGWSAHFAQRFAGQPFKSVALTLRKSSGESDPVFSQKGEFVATATGVEGSLIYAASALLRDRIEAKGGVVFELDLLPDRPLAQVSAEIAHPRGSRSLASHLKSRLHLDGIKSAILHELIPDKQTFADPALVAAAIKALPVPLAAARPIAEAISSAGGVRFAALDGGLMLRDLPGYFCAGEMLDWEAPTGGYLLTACLATGTAAGLAALAWLRVAGTRPG